jgi:hypothetical protein
MPSVEAWPPGVVMPREEAARLESGDVKMHDEKFVADAETFFVRANETGVEYFACGGTLLGAIRHGRLLPWDDDCDISVHRRDFARFLRLLALPPSFRVQRTLSGAVASTAHITIDVFVVDRAPWRRGHLAFSGPYCSGFATFFTSSVFPKDCHPSSEIYPTKTARLGGVRVRVPAESEREARLRRGLPSSGPSASGREDPPRRVDQCKRPPGGS